MMPIGSNINRDILKMLKSYLPNYYQDSYKVSEMLRVDGIELEKLNSNIRSILDQFYVETATWGLAIWEKILGVTINPVGKTYEQRRAIIISKLRGIGVVNAELIKNVLSSYANGEVQVIEPDHNYLVGIKFVGVRGIPEDMESVESVLREYLPAHLGFYFVYTYLTWNELESHNLTFNEAETYTWDQLEVAFLDNNSSSVA